MKIDCSKTVYFHEEIGRMTNHCEKNCFDCPLSSHNNGFNTSCRDFISKYTEKAVEIVQKWSDEHPQKTRLEDLLEKYPNADTELVIRDSCVRALGYPSRKDCTDDRCEDCWNMQV